MTHARTLHASRLDLRPGTESLLRAELGGAAVLAAFTGIRVPAGWPPEHFDEPAMRWSLDWIRAHPDGAGWSLYYLILREPVPTFVGIAGFKGMPDAEGTVEIGYSVIDEFRRRGFASEAVSALLTFAFADPRVRRVIAETLPGLTPSIGVLEKCGFALLGAGSEEGVIRFALERPPEPARA